MDAPLGSGPTCSDAVTTKDSAPVIAVMLETVCDDSATVKLEAMCDVPATVKLEFVCDEPTEMSVQVKEETVDEGNMVESEAGAMLVTPAATSSPRRSVPGECPTRRDTTERFSVDESQAYLSHRRTNVKTKPSQPVASVEEANNKNALFYAVEETLVDGMFRFKRLPDGSVDKNTAVCKFCHKEFAYHRSSSSLRYHLNAKHLVARMEAKANVSLAADSRPDRSKQSRRPAPDQMTGFRAKMSESTSDKLTNSLAHWIAVDCRPLAVVEDKGLETVLQIASSDPTYELPGRKTISTKIQQLYDSEKEAKECVLEEAEYVALTRDHWTSVSNSNYIGVTAHIIDRGWFLQSFALTIQKTTTGHLAANIAQDFHSVAEAWEVQQKVTTIGTDCARPMTAAAGWLPFQHMPCVAHILQRTIALSLSNSGFTDTLARCRTLVGHFKRSPANTEDLRQQQTALGQEKEPLVQDVATRWNSTLHMISSLLKNQEAVQAALAKQKHKLTMLTTSEWDKLQRLETLLEPCRFVTELLGGEIYVSCSVVLPALRHLERTMEVSDDDPAYVVRFKAAFTEELSEHQDTLNHGWLRVATALDPRFKDLKCLPRGEREGVWTSVEALLRKEPDGATPEPTKEPAKKRRRLLLFASDSDSDDEAGPNSALSLYRAEPTISETDCPLRWWSSHAGSHPQLSALARKYLASPATSVPCERIFSLAGNVVQKKRAALSSENVNRLVCLSNWLKNKQK